MYKKQLSKLRLPLCVCLSILTSCSIDDSVQEFTSCPNAIQLKANVGTLSDVATRAPYLNSPSLDNELSADIFISETSGDYATLYNTGKTTALFNSANGPGFDAPVLWPSSSSTPLYFVGTSPKAKFGTTTTTTAATADGKTDLMYTLEVKGTKGTEATPTPVPLNFKHAQVLCKLYARAENAQAVTDWGNLTHASVSNVSFDGTSYVDVPEVMILTMGTGAITVSSSAAAAFPFYQIDNTSKVVEKFTDVAFTGKAVELKHNQEIPVGYVMLPVENGEDSKLKGIEITLASANFADTKAKITQLPLPANIIAGKAVSIHLLLRQNGTITFNPVTVTDWEVTDSVTGEIGG